MPRALILVVATLVSGCHHAPRWDVSVSVTVEAKPDPHTTTKATVEFKRPTRPLVN